MIWATVAEVRAYLDEDDIPAGTTDERVAQMIEKCARALTTKVIRWPVVDDATDRAVDVEQRRHIVAAVAETVKARYEAKVLAGQLGGDAMIELIAAGGSVKAQSLAVSGGSSNTRGAKIGQHADRIPVPAIEALLAANLIGGGVPSW